LPLIGDKFKKEIPASDNVSFAIVLGKMGNALTDNSRSKFSLAWWDVVLGWVPEDRWRFGCTTLVEDKIHRQSFINGRFSASDILARLKLHFSCRSLR
jgi:hypothetical protein